MKRENITEGLKNLLFAYAVLGSCANSSATGHLSADIHSESRNPGYLGSIVLEATGVEIPEVKIKETIEERATGHPSADHYLRQRF